MVNYQNDDFPSYLHVGSVYPGARWTNKPHFHEDLEFITITKEITGYNINGERLVLEQGDTLMVNKNQIHYSYTASFSSMFKLLCSGQFRGTGH